ncbi:glycoside hydrolase family 6 protein [Streptomyces sp. P1-3]|uniref:glycoside hydrolase family 6 protein n=1 Tax=Streptomyces sp. P1-3 TaxID=3421658 RepID=UPI003D362D8C
MRSRPRHLTALMAAAATAAVPLLSGAATRVEGPPQLGDLLYTPPASEQAYEHLLTLVRRGAYRDAAGILGMVRTPHAVWYGDDPPEIVERQVRMTTSLAARQGTVPVLTLYNVPGRDCGSYSRGGAGNTGEYQAWVDAVARGIGDRAAMVILEPDSLALLPKDCPSGDEEERAGLDAYVVSEAEDRSLEAAVDAVVDAEVATEAAADVERDAADAAEVAAAAPYDAEAAVPQGTGGGAGAVGAAAPEASAPASLAPDAAVSDPPSDGPAPEAADRARKAARAKKWERAKKSRTAARYAEINHAVDALAALPRTRVYLDAGHSAWHPVPKIASRLISAGVKRATGFFINVSAYQTDSANAWYGKLISSCLAYAAKDGNPADCPTQDWPRNRAQKWLDTHVGAVDPARMKHFVTDTSRNGRGPWAPADAYRDAQDWCNPPGRGLGAQPTTRTGDPLHDAKLWVKTPGESDGLCLRGTHGPQDPERIMVDPKAGKWFPTQALELVRLAAPGSLPDWVRIADAYGRGLLPATPLEPAGGRTYDEDEDGYPNRPRPWAEP